MMKYSRKKTIINNAHLSKNNKTSLYSSYYFLVFFIKGWKLVSHKNRTLTSETTPRLVQFHLWFLASSSSTTPADRETLSLPKIKKRCYAKNTVTILIGKSHSDYNDLFKLSFFSFVKYEKPFHYQTNYYAI